MILNFGKFKGQSIESLKRSPDGVSYLEWGAANLRDDKMRRLFADTLAGMTDHERAVVISEADGIGYDEAITHVRSMRVAADEDAAEDAKEEERQNAIFTRWAAESGQPVPKLRAISNRFFMDWWEQPTSRFSSVTAHEMFRFYMKELWG